MPLREFTPLAESLFSLLKRDGALRYTFSRFTGESMMKYAALSLALLLGLSGNLLAAEPEQTQDNSTEPCSNVRNTDDNDTPWSGSERCNDSSGAESDYSDSSSSDESSVTPDQPAPMAN